MFDTAFDAAGGFDLRKSLCSEDHDAMARSVPTRATPKRDAETTDETYLAGNHVDVLRDRRTRGWERMSRESIFVNKQGILADCARALPEVAHLPFCYQIHLNYACNQKCIMCAPGGKHGKDMLSYEDFVARFAQVSGVAEHITLMGGEPLMYPHIDAVLDLLGQHEIAVTINTNATLLTPRIIPRLLRLHELTLRCSVDAATPSTYHDVRGTDVFARVAANLRRFSAAIEHHPHVRMILVYTVMRHNLHEVVPFVDFARELTVERVEFRPVRHVESWHVTNGTGWRFDGREQSCGSLREEFNAVMRRAAASCEAAGVNYHVHII